MKQEKTDKGVTPSIAQMRAGRPWQSDTDAVMQMLCLARLVRSPEEAQAFIHEYLSETRMFNYATGAAQALLMFEALQQEDIAPIVRMFLRRMHVCG